MPEIRDRFRKLLHLQDIISTRDLDKVSPTEYRKLVGRRDAILNELVQHIEELQEALKER